MLQSYQSRRQFLRAGIRGFALLAAGGLPLPGRSRYAAANPPFYGLTNLGPLQPPDENGVMLPAGFRARVVARSGLVPAGSHPWHPAPDGGACFPAADGGWIYVSNSELRDGAGGVSALRFNPLGEVIDSYPLLTGTTMNCAGGPTPWGTWLSCEEYEAGHVYECDPSGQRPAAMRPALGCFKHEAVAVDPEHGHLFLTEDLPDGGFYRFVPAQPLPELASGVLQIASLKKTNERYWVEWHTLPDPEARLTETRLQVAGYTPFNGGEGIAWHGGRIVFTTKGDNRVWWYDTNTQEIGLLYDFQTSSTRILSGLDNITITPAGDVLVAEDKGDMQLVVLSPDGGVVPLVQVVGHDRSEVAGPALSPDYRRLYFSSQRGSAGVSTGGVTFEILGPV